MTKHGSRKFKRGTHANYRRDSALEKKQPPKIDPGTLCAVCDHAQMEHKPSGKCATEDCDCACFEIEESFT